MNVLITRVLMIFFSRNAPIDVTPEGGGSGNPREFDCDVCPQYP